jgi:hypothetical protein
MFLLSDQKFIVFNVLAFSPRLRCLGDSKRCLREGWLTDKLLSAERESPVGVSPADRSVPDYAKQRAEGYRISRSGLTGHDAARKRG